MLTNSVGLTCSKDFNEASLPHAIMSSMMRCFTSGLLHSTVSVPGTLFSTAHRFTTSTSGTTMATMQLCKMKVFSNTQKLKASNTTHLQTFAMHKDLLNVLGLDVNVLNLLRHNVLALTELKDVLFAINNLQRSIRLPLTDIASVMPALCVYRLLSSIGFLEIAARSIEMSERN